SAGKYSEFVNFHLKIECGVGLPDGNSIAYQQNSYTAKQRRCPGKQGSSFAKQGHAMSACGAVRTKHRGGNLLRLVPEADITRGPCAIRAIHLELARSPGRRVRSGLLLKKRLDLIGHISLLPSLLCAHFLSLGLQGEPYLGGARLMTSHEE